MKHHNNSVTFVQIHYHNRSGGVTSVMNRYAKAFNTIAGNTTSSYFMGRDYFPNQKDRPYTTLPFPECDYADIASKKDFLALEKKISEKMLAYLKKLPQPVAVVGHNLTLGKNCALSSAFATVARSVSRTNNRINFFSVIHDFAEEGRIANILQIGALEKWGIDAWKSIYPAGKNITYITLNPFNYRLLKSNGFHVRYLPNPLDVLDAHRTFTPHMRKQFLFGLAAHGCKQTGLPAKKALLCFYPARVIGRKNCLEAILLCVSGFKGTLVLGDSGTSKTDRMIYRRIRQLCTSKNLSVIFDVDRIRRSLPNDCWGYHSIFALMYKCADAVVSTSVAEGFGYALYESWMYGKKRLFRKPVNFKGVRGADFGCVYDRLLVPCAWIDLEHVKEKYQTYYHELALAQHLPFIDTMKQFKENFIYGNSIDFGCLDTDSQIDVLETVCKAPRLMQNVRIETGGKFLTVAEARLCVIHQKKNVLDRQVNSLSSSGFVNSFRKTVCMADVPTTHMQPVNRKKIGATLCTLKTLRLCMNPEK